MKVNQDFENLVFCNEILSAADLCIVATNRLNALVPEGDPIAIFECLTSILHNITRIALVLWPSDSGQHSKNSSNRDAYLKRAARGERLRDLIGIDGDDLILQDRKFRNNFAHIDERIDLWLEGGAGALVRFNIGPRHGFGGFDDSDLFEHFDPNTATIYFRGDTFNLRDAVNAAIRIRGKAQAKIDAFRG